MAKCHWWQFFRLAQNRSDAYLYYWTPYLRYVKGKKERFIASLIYLAERRGLRTQNHKTNRRATIRRSTSLRTHRRTRLPGDRKDPKRSDVLPDDDTAK